VRPQNVSRSDHTKSGLEVALRLAWF